MPSKVFKLLQSLDLEERILNGASIVAMVGVLLPWIGGDWPGGEQVRYTGFGYSTSLLGITIFLLHAFILAAAVVPLVGGPVLLRKTHRDIIRLWISAQACILVLAALSVLMRVSSLEFTRMDVRFGIYVCLIASIVTLFEASQRWMAHRKTLSQELFHHPEDQKRPEPAKEAFAAAATPPPPPPPPPPAPQPEDHRIYP